MKQPIDRVVLLDVAAFELKIHNAATKRHFQLKRRFGQSGIGGQDVELPPVRRAEKLCVRRIVIQLDIDESVNLMLVASQSIGDGIRLRTV